MKKAAKKTTAKKVVAKNAVKKVATKKVATKKTVKKVADAKPVKKTAVKKVVAKKTVKKVAAKNAPKTAAKEEASKPTAKAVVVRSGVTLNSDDKKATPIVFSLDDVVALMATKKKEKKEEEKPTTKKVAPVKKKVVEVDDAPVEKRVLGAASLADILGFNPAEKKKSPLEEDDVPAKWKKFYKLLLNLRALVRDELDLHTSDTLKHSSREDSNISGYGNHQADAATDSFDRDFALSLVSNEQEALNEIEEAIQRNKNGSYGVCEVTGKAIPKERLNAVPFARFSVQGQAEYEKNKRRKINRDIGGIFGDESDATKIVTDDDE
ncbi:MAG: TraR/DksA C4-type zinc finger protein [Opitutales bacterium]|nr:TraR/DksA C4-type zinc finger protein [Opitutales bacterium]